MYTIEAERLIVRELTDSDVPLLAQMFARPTTMQWLFGGTPMSAEEAGRFIREHFTFGRLSYGLGVLCEKKPERFVGFAGLLPCRYLYEDDFELGFALIEDARRKGYATEIGRAQIVYGFETLSVHRLLALVHPQNRASLRTLEKIGMKLLKTIRTEERGPRRVYVVKRPA
ncbi:MAG TPA: GNAT family N-acetyltransferase [Syntrophorhabdaceae bacterium]|nr:GNAT family N-acetyltransferase [Syntrophorhabdaceae bacterium]